MMNEGLQKEEKGSPNLHVDFEIANLNVIVD